MKERFKAEIHFLGNVRIRGSLKPGSLSPPVDGFDVDLSCVNPEVAGDRPVRFFKMDGMDLAVWRSEEEQAAAQKLEFTFERLRVRYQLQIWRC